MEVKAMRHSIAVALAAALVVVAVCQSEGESAKPRKRSEAEKAEARARSREKWALVSKLKRLTAAPIEQKLSDTEIVRGFVTYSFPNPDGGGYVAYVYLRWGDLDRKVEKPDKKHYQSWNGYVRVTPGRATVDRSFAFDDYGRVEGTGKRRIAERKENFEIGERKEREGLEERYRRLRDQAGRKYKNADSRAKRLRYLSRWRKDQLNRIAQRAAKRRSDLAKSLTAREGSDRDEMLTKRSPSQVVWKSGTVGTTDGLLVRLDMEAPTATGAIKVGKADIAFAILPKPDDKEPTRGKSRKRPVEETIE